MQIIAAFGAWCRSDDLISGHELFFKQPGDHRLAHHARTDKRDPKVL
jgi:hypothetical protein